MQILLLCCFRVFVERVCVLLWKQATFLIINYIVHLKGEKLSLQSKKLYIYIIKYM